jgi:biotin synthase
LKISDIINLYKRSSADKLAKKADEICKETYGNYIYLRGLVEFSNHCGRDCLYCGIRKSNKNITRYRMTEEEIAEVAGNGYKVGLRSFVLQSGEDDYFTVGRLASIVSKVKEATNFDAAVTLSCGIKTKSEYKELKRSGADRYLLRFETSNESLHKHLRKGISLARRLKALEDLRDLGYEVGSGYMVGLPGETEEIRIKNAMLCRKYKFDMVGIGPFIPHPETPLKGSVSKGSIDLTVKAVALVRMLLPDINIPATSASGSIDVYGREKVLVAGANVLMPNITPPKYKKNYLIYPGKICVDESGFECIDCLKNKVALVGKEINFNRGDSVRYLRSMEAVNY